MIGSRRVYAGSRNLDSRPGKSAGATSICGPSRLDQARKIELPPPAYGKQNKRKRARDSLEI
jgi:hypothetical protein